MAMRAAMESLTMEDIDLYSSINEKNPKRGYSFNRNNIFHAIWHRK
mgnify:CR=1 FL=1